MGKSKNKKQLTLSSIVGIFKEIIFNSIGIKGIKYEEVYMFGWWAAVACLTVGIARLRMAVNFLSVYTFILSVILIVLLIFLGRIGGEKISYEDKKQIK
ncbi:MAG: hypothetical protein ABFR75_05605 [Acidobacteriota bacterium]